MPNICGHKLGEQGATLINYALKEGHITELDLLCMDALNVQEYIAECEQYDPDWSCYEDY